MKKTYRFYNWIVFLIIFLLIAFSVLIFASLGGFELIAYALDNDMHGTLEMTDDPNSDSIALLYQEATYYYDGGWVWMRNPDNDRMIEVGYRNMFPFPRHYYYVLTEEDPLCILSRSGGGSGADGVFFRSDIDFRNKVYYVSGTEIELVLSEVVTKCDDDIPFDGKSDNSLYLYLKDDPRFYIQILSLYKSVNDWYIWHNDEKWLLSEEFASALKSSNIISE